MGSDTLNGGAGTNTLDFSNGSGGLTINLTTLTETGWGTDTFSNFSKYVGSNSGDTITGSAGSDSILGGSGADYFYATAGTDTLNGGAGY